MEREARSHWLCGEDEARLRHVLIVGAKRSQLPTLPSLYYYSRRQPFFAPPSTGKQGGLAQRQGLVSSTLADSDTTLSATSADDDRTDTLTSQLILLSLDMERISPDSG